VLQTFARCAHETDKETRVTTRTFHVKRRFLRRLVQGCIVVVIVASCGLSSPTARAQGAATLSTNTQTIEDLARPPAFDVRDPLRVLAYVLDRLPDEVRVYPTENYFYFTLSSAGVAWGGSLRFGPGERAKGQLELSVYKALTDWNDTLEGIPRALLGAAEGVRVDVVDAFAARVTLGARSVLFRLNDLSGVMPPPASVAPDERVLGPIFDESAVRFFLVYNGRQKLFHYLLNETVPLPDVLEPLAGAERIVIGRRTGFAFFRDHLRERKILIGVYEPNSRLNTWLDGPFDQLPENFIEGEALREAIVASDPEAKGQIDRLGHYLKEEGRYLIHPYMLYRKTSDLLRIETCARQRLKRADYARCFVVEPEVTGPPPAQPLRKR
jgi:hypothetical protein